MSLFGNLLPIMDISLDRVFGENFALVPMRAVTNGAPVPDDTRASVPLFGAIFADASAPLMADIPGSTQMSRVQTMPRLSVSSLEIPYRPRRPDRIVRAKTGRVYEVQASYPDDQSRIVIDLVEVE